MLGRLCSSTHGKYRCSTNWTSVIAAKGDAFGSFKGARISSASAHTDFFDRYWPPKSASLRLLLLLGLILPLLLSLLLLLLGLILLLLLSPLLLLLALILPLLLSLLLLLFALILLLLFSLLIFVLVLLLLCIDRSSDPEKQEQNSCADKSDSFHLCILQSFSLGDPSGLPQGVPPRNPTNQTCFSETSCSEWKGAISPKRGGESCY